MLIDPHVVHCQRKIRSIKHFHPTMCEVVNLYTVQRYCLSVSILAYEIKCGLRHQRQDSYQK